MVVGIVAMSEAKKKGSSAFVLFLSCIALVGIINTMLMSVLEKRQEIGTLKALGMREKDIGRLFLIEGAILGFFGAHCWTHPGSCCEYLLCC